MDGCDNGNEESMITDGGMDGGMDGGTDWWSDGADERREGKMQKEIKESLVYGRTDGRIDGMMGERRRPGWKSKGKRGAGGVEVVVWGWWGGPVFKHGGIRASQRREINGASLSVTVALCARRSVIKQPPPPPHHPRTATHTHTHLAPEWGSDPVLFRTGTLSSATLSV